MSTKTIMYVGNPQGLVRDRVNSAPERIWNHVGDFVAGIPDVHAQKLLKHPDEFADVSGLTDSQLVERAAKAVRDADERIRQATNAPKGIDMSAALRSADGEQLVIELARRYGVTPSEIHNRLMRPVNEGTSAQASLADTPQTDDDGELEQGANQNAPGIVDPSPGPERDATVAEKVMEAIDTIMSQDNPDLNDEGVPTLDAIQQVIGFSISEDEYRVVLDSLGQGEQAATA